MDKDKAKAAFWKHEEDCDDINNFEDAWVAGAEWGASEEKAWQESIDSDSYVRSLHSNIKKLQSENQDLHEILIKIKAENQKLRECLESFLEHYDSRKITNGYHDLLANKCRQCLKEIEGE